MPNLKPLQNVDSYNYLNMNTPLSGASVPKGTFVRFVGSGINLQDNAAFSNITPVGNGAYGSFMPFLGAPTGGLLAPAVSGEELLSVGVTQYDQLTYDEYQTYLLYNGVRAAQLNCIITGQAMPVIQAGFVYISGINGTPAAGSGAQLDVAGGTRVVGPAVTPVVGKFLGPKDANGFALLSIKGSI